MNDSGFNFISRSPLPGRAQELPRNDPRLFEPVKCRVIRRFCAAAGKPVEVGELITLSYHDFISMHAIGRVVLVE